MWRNIPFYPRASVETFFSKQTFKEHHFFLYPRIRERPPAQAGNRPRKAPLVRARTRGSENAHPLRVYTTRRSAPPTLSWYPPGRAESTA